MKDSTIIGGAIAITVIGVVVQLAIYGGLIYAAVHFINKFW